MQVLELLKAALNGLIEGITEWLPVSSTAHIRLLERFLPFQGVSEGFPALFEVVIQLGAIIAVILYMWNKIWPFGRDEQGRIRSKKTVWLTWAKVVVACLPLPIIKLLDLDELISGDNLLAIAIALIVVGILFIVVEELRKGKKPTVRSLRRVTFPMALGIGVCQAVAAVFPGTSRSGATIIGALLMGISRRVAVEFTFILAIPVMLGASLMDLIKLNAALAANEIALLAVGCIVALAVSLLVIRPLLNYIKRHSFKLFGTYRIALGIVILAYLWMTRAM